MLPTILSGKNSLENNITIGNNKTINSNTKEMLYTKDNDEYSILHERATYIPIKYIGRNRQKNRQLQML